jgi:parallel beta-helix repeat protein
MVGPGPTANAEVIYVCWDGSGDFLTIQEGIDAAVDGDEVVVCDGVYTGAGNKNLDFGGKAITVRSANGPDNCVIDCEGEGRGFYFHSAEREASVLSGFTIQNGYVGWDDPAGGYGSGICCQESSPTISDCTIRRNTTHGVGGGICCEFSSATIDNCTITQNIAEESSGGGVYVDRGNAAISNCTVTDNTAMYEGGGIHCASSDPVIGNCAISGNTAYTGAALFCEANSGPAVSNCTITGNTAHRGGAVYCVASSVAIANCTIVGNAATYQGGGIYCYRSATLTIANCVLWGDSAAQGPEIALRSTDYPSTLTISYSDIKGGEAAAYVEDGCTLNWGEGNIDADPTFAFRDDRHLMGGSPCIDAGTNHPPGGLPPEDPDGNPRPLDGDGDSVATADMGVYEFNPDAPSIGCSPATLAFLVPEGGPNPDDQILSIRNCGGGMLNWEISAECPWLEVEPLTGQSAGEIDEVILSVSGAGLPHGQYGCALAIADPQAVNSPRTIHVTLNVYGTLHVPSEYAAIQEAIDSAVEGDTVLVADGTYMGPGNKNLDLYGKDITVRSENGPENCIIDCEGDGRGFYFRRHESGATVVDGLTITNGNVQQGAGVRCQGWSSPTITNCAITGNAADYQGGGVCCDSSSPTLSNCTISDNVAHYNAGMSNSRSNPILTNCTFAGNLADSDAAGIGNVASNPLLLNCVFGQNSSGHYGGAMYNWSASAPLLINCAFAGNSADEWGGAVFGGYDSRISLVNCTFSGNTAVNAGGAIWCGFRSEAAMTNCLLWGDSAGRGPEIALQYHNLGSSTLAVSYSDVEGGEAGVYVFGACELVWGPGNIDADPLFVDADGGDYHLSGDSPCIDAGCNWGVPPDVADLDDDADTSEITPLDLDGEGRFFDDPDTVDTGCGCPPLVDMGAYEFGDTGPQPCPGDLDCDRTVGHSDLGILLAAWHVSADGDLNCDGVTDHADLSILLGHWGEACP